MNNNASRFLITFCFGWLGVHKFLSKQTGMGILYFFTFGIFGIGWIIDSFRAFLALFSKSPANTSGYDIPTSYNYPYFNEEVQKASQKYYSGVEELEAMWSVLYNLKLSEGPQVDNFEAKCYENITNLNIMLQVEKRHGVDAQMPLHVPAYVRLAMLYEKQNNYERAIDICVSAIKVGAVNDGNKGKMYGRLARLINKAGITVDDEILTLIDKQANK